MHQQQIHTLPTQSFNTHLPQSFNPQVPPPYFPQYPPTNSGSCVVEYLLSRKDQFSRRKESCDALSCILLCADHFHINNLIVDEYS